MAHSALVYWFSDVDKHDHHLLGKKATEIGEMSQAGIPVPNGFIISSQAYFDFLRENNLAIKIKNLLSTVNFDQPESVQQVSHHIQKMIMDGTQSKELTKEVTATYETLSGFFRESLVVMSPSITVSDVFPTSAFGKQNIFTNVRGDANVLVKIKEIWASLFEPQAISHRHIHNLDHFRIGNAVIIQLVIAADQAGNIFTIDPVTNDKTKMVIEAMYGVANEKSLSDHYEIDKTDEHIGKKQIVTQEAYLKRVANEVKQVQLDTAVGSRQKISDEQIKELAQLGKTIEKTYYFPQHISWAIQGNNLYVLETKTITNVKTEKQHVGPYPQSKTQLTKGSPAAPGIASGPARIIHTANDVEKIQAGDVVFIEETNIAFLPHLKKAKAIVTEQGGRMSHAAVTARALGIPAISNSENARSMVQDNIVVTVNGGLGEVYVGGHISAGNAPIHHFTQTLKTATKVYVNMVSPLTIEKTAASNVDGIGLLPAEPMIVNIGVHPKKMIRDGKRKEFIFQLADQIEVFCKAFSPRPVIYRVSDFKTHEYRKFIGGHEYEPLETNPFIGYRGAYRYIHDPEVFELELEAIKLVRNKKGFKNLWMMVPFVRNVRELIDVKKIMSSAGLYRSPTFKLYMMVDTPSNVILLDQFINVGIDGVSVDSDDLTTLLLGTDRNNSEVAHEFNEQDESVLWALERIIKTAQKHHIPTSISGQAPGLYPNVLEKLVKWGVSSVSVSPNVVDAVRDHIAEIESRM